MKIIIFGGFGFFGKHIATKLQDEGHDVFTLSRRNGYDLTHYPQIKQALKQLQPDVIYNCAAHVGGLHYVSKRHATIANDNMQMALNLYKGVQAAAPDALIINPLSNCSYPGEAELYSESDWLNGEVHPSVYSYGNAKRILFMLSRCYAEQHGTRTYNFLVPNAFGPGDSNNPNRVHALNGMIIRMIQAHRSDSNEFAIWGTGSPIREWIYVEDVANLMNLALAVDIDSPEPINLAQQEGASIKESAELIAKAIGFSGDLVFQPQYQDGAPQKIMNADRFQQVFPNYRFVNHYEGIQATVDHYQNALPKLALAA